jgi:hypothetical protein
MNTAEKERIGKCGSIFQLFVNDTKNTEQEVLG